jgi:hypothetical protein
MFRKSPTMSRPSLPVDFANVLLFLVPRDGANCTSIAQQAGVNQSTIQSLNPGVNCAFFRTHFSGRAKLNDSSF